MIKFTPCSSNRRRCSGEIHFKRLQCAEYALPYMKPGNSVAPVSYTHLDVYKRQDVNTYVLTVT